MGKNKITNKETMSCILTEMLKMQRDIAALTKLVKQGQECIRFVDYPTRKVKDPTVGEKYVNPGHLSIYIGEKEYIFYYGTNLVDPRFTLRENNILEIDEFGRDKNLDTLMWSLYEVNLNTGIWYKKSSLWHGEQIKFGDPDHQICPKPEYRIEKDGAIAFFNLENLGYFRDPVFTKTEDDNIIEVKDEFVDVGIVDIDKRCEAYIIDISDIRNIKVTNTKSWRKIIE